MTTEYRNGNVSARCPDCDGALTTFEHRKSGGEYGHVIRDEQHEYQGNTYNRFIYVLMRCGGCGRGGLATIHDRGNVSKGVLEEFFLFSIDTATLPDDVPSGVGAEFREAEQCAAFGAWRAASALLRSVLEKTLKANGYKDGVLAAKIDAAANDGVITEARKRRAHEEVRVLGNDVLHDEWKEISSEDVAAARHYAQRILEDFYDDRASVERQLKAKERLT